MQNKKRKFNKESAFVSILVLFLITGLTTGLLAGVNLWTKPIIAQNEEKKQQGGDDGPDSILQEAAEFEDISADFNLGDYPGVEKVERALDENGKQLATVVETLVDGYGGVIKVRVAFSNSLAIADLDVDAPHETGNIGKKLAEPEFAGLFLDREPGKYFSLEAGDDTLEIDSLSGSTISSEAVVNAVNAAVDFANGELEAGEDGLAGVLNKAADFEDISADFNLADYPLVDKVEKALNADGKELATVVEVTVDGYGGKINVRMAIAKDLSLGDISIEAPHETGNIGKKLAEAEFSGKFLDREPGKYFSIGAVGDNIAIDSLSGSTVSSEAVVNAVNAGLEFVNNELEATSGGEGDE